jgi:23S rRNA (cytosine1962-C5)-methyltransferase
MTLNSLFLKKNEDRRIRQGHPWIYSNEVDTKLSPLKNFTKGEEVRVLGHDKKFVGMATVNPHSLIVARVYSAHDGQTLHPNFFQEKIEQALFLRDQLFDKPFYRLIFGEADGLPGLIIDRFGDHVAMQTNTAGMELKQTEIASTLQKVFPQLQSILLKNTSSVRQQEGLEPDTRALFGEPPQEILLEENGVQFAAPFWTGQKTAWFYDHRPNRVFIKPFVKNKKVLDVFSYLGAFGITAATLGAASVDCVDASALACEYIQKNAALNDVAARVKVINDDAFDALKKLVQEKQSYDVILLDPPAFIKRAKDKKEGFLAYQRINELALQLLSPNGILVSCSCSMHMSDEELLEAINRAAFKAKSSLQLIARGHQGADHPVHPLIPETNYLKALVLRKTL